MSDPATRRRAAAVGGCGGRRHAARAAAADAKRRRPVGLCKLNYIDPQLESDWFQPSNLSNGNRVSKFAFKCNLYRYRPGGAVGRVAHSGHQHRRGPRVGALVEPRAGRGQHRRRRHRRAQPPHVRRARLGRDRATPQLTRSFIC
jgi:hypothetical protein